MKNKLLVIMAVIGTIILVFLDQWQLKRWHQEQAAELEGAAKLCQTRLQNSMASRFNSLEALVALFVLHPETAPGEFSDFAHLLMEFNPPIRALQYADSDTRMKYVYPERGNEVTINHPIVLSSDSVRGPFVEKAIRMKKMVIQGPYELRQGGAGIVARTPVFSGNRFLGLVIGVYDLPVLLNEAFGGIVSDKIQVRLQDEENRVFYGPDATMEHFVEKAVLAADTRWIMTVAWAEPYNTPPALPRMIVFFGGGGILILLLMIAYMAQTQSQRLEKTVIERTERLSAANNALTGEIARRRLAEEALKESKANYQDLYDNSPDMYLSVDAETAVVIDCNQTLVNATGYGKDEIIGRKIFELYTPASAEMAEKQIFPEFIKTGVVSGVELKIQKKDGGTIDVSLSVTAVRNQAGEIVRTRSVWRDITSKKELEAGLVQSQKMEAIGSLAGGVAHEINNPINGIMNYAQLVIDKTEKDNPVCEYAEEIITETNRVAAIVRSLLSFARQDDIISGKVQIGEIIHSSLSLIQVLARHDQIKIVVDIPARLPDISCRRQQIQQVIMNLITNARDALNEKYPAFDENKVICVSAAVFEKNGKTWLRTTIEDRGAGIDMNIRNRIFDPFFTTKGRDAGTGLGLSISYNIVKNHQGVLRVETKPGQYTRFHMELPVHVSA